jgi:hypothetical protein
MTFLTAESFTREAKTEEVEIKGIGTARITELTRSRKQKFDAWLRPGGELDVSRDESRDLKLCVLCLVDGNDDLLFDLDDAEFDSFVADLQDKAAGPWLEVSYQVLRVNGYIKEIDDEPTGNELLEK